MAEKSKFRPSFDAVLRQAKDGDSRSFEQLYDALYRRVLTFVRMRGAPDPEAVASEVFLHVFTNLNKFSGAEEQFNGWVFRIARNQLIDGHRRQQRRVIEVGGQISETSQAVDDVESIAIANVELDSIVAVLHQLSSDQQDVVMLRIVADLTLEATANVMGKRIGAVKALQRRAFKKLSKILFLKSVTL